MDWLENFIKNTCFQACAAANGTVDIPQVTRRIHTGIFQQVLEANIRASVWFLQMDTDPKHISQSTVAYPVVPGEG